ncbi:cyclin-domain-containing protein [Cokeromyces recurvatus]|uniref:cyclin-domain-containing protein n=1 Tax=Cokeromyces recurvatus TaxID=90255 RepID=UPI002220880A|nr:cyclin-domain-containing protein [Cokeromyces recurvatus]KAI7901821.1 cyclin-domain-containing protein [Cokeromyces recurvatus]
MAYPTLFLSKIIPQMSELVIQMVPKIWSGNTVQLSTSYSNAFRFYCQNIFKTTQISNSCILVALFYIYRLRYTYPSIQASMGSEVRLFTTALILSNKYLDDNTFTNKTWSEVSGISLKELNIMEIEFLTALQYKICVHHNQFASWAIQCQQWMAQFVITSLQSLQLQSPILDSVTSPNTPICTTRMMRQTNNNNNKRSADHFSIENNITISIKKRPILPLTNKYQQQQTMAMWNPIFSRSSSLNHPAAATVATAAAASAMNVNYSSFIPRV